MADTKISALTGATTPLAGTEVVPVVQGGQTRKVATDDLTVKNVRSNATTGILQVAGPGTGTTRTMTIPDANFTAARTDAGQTFSGAQIFGSGVTVSGGKLTAASARGGDFVAEFQNTTSATPYGVWIKDAATPTAGYPLLNISDSTGGTTYFRVDSSNGNQTLGVGNLAFGTANKGIDFSANAHAAGMTSELFNDYEEGTWTPTVTSTSGTITSFGTRQGFYTKIGRQVTLWGSIEVTNNGTGAGSISVASLPYTPATSTLGGNGYIGSGYNTSSGALLGARATSGGTIGVFRYDGVYPVGTGQSITFCVTYFV